MFPPPSPSLGLEADGPGSCCADIAHGAFWTDVCFVILPVSLRAPVET